MLQGLYGNPGRPQAQEGRIERRRRIFVNSSQQHLDTCPLMLRD
jgi:hypothetical protein